MKRYFITGFIAFIALSGCETISKQRSVDDSYDNFGLVINGERIEDLKFGKRDTEETVLENKTIQNAIDALEKVLEDTPYASLNLRNKSDRETLRKILSDIYEGNTAASETPANFTGWCGLSSILAARSLFDIFDRPTRTPIKVKGKIRDYVFHLDNPKEMKGHGHLAVEMRSDYLKPGVGGGVIFEREILHWDVEVRKNGYRIVKRQGSEEDVPDPGRIFPETITLPDAMRDPDNPDSIWGRGLDYKLFAKGKSIYVRSIYRQIDDGPLELLPRTHAFYQMTDCSCIDIMFAGKPPKLTLPKQRSYCLGRCQSPFIMNTD